MERIRKYQVRSKRLKWDFCGRDEGSISLKSICFFLPYPVPKWEDNIDISAQCKRSDPTQNFFSILPGYILKPPLIWRSRYQSHNSQNTGVRNLHTFRESSLSSPIPFPYAVVYALPVSLHLNISKQIFTPVKSLVGIAGLILWPHGLLKEKGITSVECAGFGVSIQSSQPWEGLLSLLNGGTVGCGVSV